MTIITKHFLKNFNNISEYYNFLVLKTKKKEFVGITNEWLIDNYYLLVEYKKDVFNDKKNLKNKKLIQKMYFCIKDIVVRNNYNINFKILTTELKKYQKEIKRYFSYEELVAIKKVLLFIYVEKLNNIFVVEKANLLDEEKIGKIIKDSHEENLELNSFIDSSFLVEKNSHYIFEINNQLKGLGAKSNKLFKELNQLLTSKKISLKELVNDQYQIKISNNILVSNIFNNLKLFLEISNEDLFEKVSYTEKLFMEDEIYNKMTVESKNLYRNQLVKLSKKKKISEFSCLDSLFNNADRDNYHIGFQLFKNNNMSNLFKVIGYILIVFLATVFCSLYLSKYFIDFRIIGFIILLVPVSQLFIQIFNYLATRFVKPQVLPKLDYSKGIPVESRTMVVIPTIISNKEKVKEMFDVLETFYLINKSNNLYFTLLGDVKASDKEVLDIDKEISDYGVLYATKLNKKYKKDLFYFVYRKRIWNEKENSFLGYERKRGALLHFNKILLNTFSSSLNKKYFNVNMLYKNDLNIKYVITLDTDTRLVLNTALNLVGAMAHPINRPVLNENKTKVISGYGIMQPRVSVDIESTNKSLYSQIFAGIGGFDTYSAIVPNFYQDLFKEGSFVGKGIYDLEIFDQLLSDTFPDNLILSHDLLEGNYLRCGYVGDIELIDDFPSKFLIDVTRHHRWARGDVQIVGWLKNKVYNKNNKEVKNPTNLLGKFKIFDNIVRMFLYPSLLLILLCSLFFSEVSNWWWFGFVILEIALPIIFFFSSKMYYKGRENATIYYKNLFFGGKSLLLRSYIVLATLPYYTKLYMDAFFRSLYRLFVSHNNLLNWITAEEVEKTVKDNLAIYIKNFMANIIVSVILLVLGITFDSVGSILLALVFFSAPFVLYLVSLDIDHERVELSDKKQEEIRTVAYKTWKYFKDNLKEEYNYLIPDNYQENREEKIDFKTSPTGIGFSLVSVVGAYELEFITKEDAVSLLENILRNVDSLEKWNGHLYNWYNIKTKKVMYPEFISTVDSGNLVASLIVTREFLDKINQEKLVKLCDKLINNTNFKKLYTKKDVFSIGYDVNEGRLSIYNYNKFASESRLTSYLTICLGDVPSKHWFCLDKSLTTYKGRKGLISWSGTSFEYFMPLLFMKNYPNTLLDETYNFAYFCQKDYMDSVSHKLPWGISESAYNELDNSLNYKYKAFATPYLKAKEDKENRIVLSPYSSLMLLELYPDEVYENMNKFKDLNMFGKYGFYEAYDYDKEGVVKSFFAHHQGMSLAGIVNYLKKDAIKNYFHENVNIRTFDILLKEKVQIRSNIDMRMAKYKKYDYQKEIIENDIRAFNYISYMPEVSVLSNKKYCLLMNDRGNSFSRYRTLQLNRYRKVTEQDYGIFLYIKDLDDNNLWSNTYAPTNKKADKYEVVFATDKIKYIRSDGDISTKTEIVVSKDYNAEIRKITFKNDSDNVKALELTTYTEPILSENMDDVSHKVFNNMFMSSEYYKEKDSLIMKRKHRGDNGFNSYMVNRLFIEEPIDQYSYETERGSFIGRNHWTSNPISLNKELSNYSGDNLDPVMSIRNRIRIEAHSRKSVYLIVGFGRSREQILDIINTYDNPLRLEEEFKISTLMSVNNTKGLNITGSDMRTYNVMLNYLYQTTKISVTEERMDLLRKNALGQSGLWKFGVSGDRPIILVEISDIVDLNFVFEILKAFEYYKNNSIFVDIIIINNESSQYSRIIKKEIDDELYRMYTLNSFYHTPGSVAVVDSNSINREDKSLLNMVPRLKFIINNHKSLKDMVLELQEHNTISDYSKYEAEDNIDVVYKDKLTFNNNYGGFKNNGSEYVIYNKDTPTPWSNIIANEKFGTIVTNNGCGYTYAYNSSEFKLTSWTNEMVLNDKSEGFRFNGKVFNPTKCTHGFGYSVLESETFDLKKKVTEFVPINDNVKIYLLEVTNKLSKKVSVDTSFWINPVFGNFEEKTSRHILTEFIDKDNYLKMRNVYSNNFGDVNVFISSSEKIKDTVNDRILVKSVDITIDLEKDEKKTIVFLLGCSMSDQENISLIKKYGSVNYCRKELKAVKDKWRKELKTIEVKTPDESFDYMINGWYLYQTLSARILAKSGFYQVSGAFGYRDQLQDAMNIAMVKPEFTRKQILINAKHQFMEGDVLHWWHENNRFGLRSRYKDDFLWLVYAVCHYIEVTGDYSILDEKVPYVLGENLSQYEHERGLVFSYSTEEEPLLEHCFKSLNLSMNSLGRHKIPLMGGGDWNDGMNRVGIKGKGESVWLGFFLYNVIDEFVKILKKYDRKIDVDKYIKFNDELKDNLNKNTWDGKYYLRAFFDNGDKLGSHENSECKIDLISQSFSIISGVASNDRIEKAIASVEDNLVDKEIKIIKLLTPAFDKSLNTPGYIMNYPKGIRENGGQYTHSVAWYLMALIKAGYYDRAYSYYQMINPINRSLNKDSVDNYMVEPYVIAADIYSANNHKGRGGWTWYTGSAGWFYRVGIIDILGIKKNGNILKLDPKIPTEWSSYKVCYNYGNTTYNIEVIRDKKEELVLDHKKQNSNSFKLIDDGYDHEVVLHIK